MLTGTITASTSGSGQCSTPIEMKVASPNERPDHGAVAKQRPCHFGDCRHHQAGRGRGDAGQHMAKRRKVAVRA